MPDCCWIASDAKGGGSDESGDGDHERREASDDDDMKCLHGMMKKWAVRRRVTEKQRP